MDVPLPSKFKMPSVEGYHGFSNPVDHLDTFKILIQLQGAPYAIMCQPFAATLKGNYRAWYQTLKLRSIISFFEMEQQFTGHFINSRRIAKTLAHLMILIQGEREILKKFMHRFINATLEIRNLDHGVVVEALTTALQLGDFLNSLGKKPLTNM
ncbi:uncharacterized protein LOC131163468 [Malania oleifera]|uniref:uncharacterized protein LOC131163468 n=1 Tax=Malania oleifera TaxID=397392 RepID=UPI0025AE895A|nr:uncharacterized protein LOC131163468 [Malania oleifera]